MSWLDRLGAWRREREWKDAASDFMVWHLRRHSGAMDGDVVVVNPETVEAALAFVMRAMENSGQYGKKSLAERDQLRADVERLAKERDEYATRLRSVAHVVRRIGASDHPQHCGPQADEESDQ